MPLCSCATRSPVEFSALTERLWGPRKSAPPGRTPRAVRRGHKPGLVPPLVARGAAVIIRLGPPLPTGSSGLPRSFGRAALKRSKSDLAPGGVCLATPVSRDAGALLPHPFSLTEVRRPPVPRRRATLETDPWVAVCSLLHLPSGHPDRALPGTLPCGARTFLPCSTTAETPSPTTGEHPSTTHPPLLTGCWRRGGRWSRGRARVALSLRALPRGARSRERRGRSRSSLGSDARSSDPPPR